MNARAAQATTTQFRIVGHGWGHGIGLSQYGALGFANKGYTAQQIVAFYYQHTTLGQTPTSATNVDVDLADAASAVRIQVIADGATLQPPTGAAVPLQIGDVVTAHRSGNKTFGDLTRAGAKQRLWRASTTPVQLDGPDGSLKPLLRADNGAYGNVYRGSLRLVASNNRLYLINRVALESYLLGVVPSEMPSSWPAEALKAQAIAARSYAIATKSSTGIYDLHCDTRSQMYLGMDNEQATSTAAVQATAGQVVDYNGQVITAFFSSSDGGRTASEQDVWGGASQPYLVSVRDPYDHSPYSTWTETYTPSKLEKGLGGVGGRLVAISETRNASRRAAQVTMRGTHGTRSVPGSSVQSRLGLRSSYFGLETLTLNIVPGKGNRVTVTGTAPKRGATYLMQRLHGSQVWTRIARVHPRKYNIFRLHAIAPIGTTLRLMRNKLPGPGIHITARSRAMRKQHLRKQRLRRQQQARKKAHKRALVLRPINSIFAVGAKIKQSKAAA